MSSASPQEILQSIQIRALEGPEDFQKAEQVQLETWGYSDRDLVPAAIFSVAHNFGGQALGAFDGCRMIGFALSFGAAEGIHVHFHSHMVAIVPEYQNRGVGRLIKLAQREDALARGIDQISWTFDPLQVRNAYFNIVKLGATGVRYIPNLYGKTSSPLHSGMPTDRVVMEWNLNSPRVHQALQNASKKPGPGALVVRIPVIADDLLQTARLRRQADLREPLMAAMANEFTITGLERNGETASYVLELEKQ